MEYEIRYGKRKSIALSVKKDGRVVVNAPRSTSVKIIENIIEKHSAWIEKAKARVALQSEYFKEHSTEKIAEL